MPLTFLSEVDHPHENGDIPMEGIPSVRRELVSKDKLANMTK